MPATAPGPELRGSAPGGRTPALTTRPPAARFEDLGKRALEEEARALGRGKADLPGAMQRWRALLARNLSADERFQAQLGYGSTLRAGGEVEEARTVATSRNALAWHVPSARWNTVIAMIELGDEVGARRELEAMIEDYAGEGGMDALVRQYRSQLAQLE